MLPTIVGRSAEGSGMLPTIVGRSAGGLGMLPTIVGKSAEGSGVFPTIVGKSAEGSGVFPTIVGCLLLRKVSIIENNFLRCLGKEKIKAEEQHQRQSDTK